MLTLVLVSALVASSPFVVLKWLTPSACKRQVSVKDEF
jgi:hypothetical protein